MLTYQIRPRIFRHEVGKPLVFPATCEIHLHLQPLQPFGADPSGGRTAVRAVQASTFFNANNGQHYVVSKDPLKPLDVTIEEPERQIRVSGRVFTVVEKFDTLDKLAAMVDSLYFGLPVLLNVTFADPPYVERVEGFVGGNPFRWELSEWRAEFKTTTQDRQESEVANAWDRMGILAAPQRRRLLAALHYFHVACRLARQGDTAGEFVAEVLLNLSKTLEVLFPPSGDGRTRDAARKGLARLSFTAEEIEANFLPAMALRNELDVGHVELGLFTMTQLKIVHAYTDRAEGAFRSMFDRLLAQIEQGKAEVALYNLTAPRPEAASLIERLRQLTPKDAV